MNNLHVKTGDTVMVMTGKDKGTKGKVVKAFPATGKIIVEGVALVKRHQKPRNQQQQGGIITKEAAIDASNVNIVCPKCGKPTRVGHKFVQVGDKNVKVRVCKKANCGAQIDN